MYTCGPTVYGAAHLGNLRTYLFADLLRRTLEFNGYVVKQVMNITDVGHLTDDADQGQDKIEESAKQAGQSAKTIARQYEQIFFDNLEKLNVKTPTKTLRATDTIDLQIALVKKLEAKKVVYRTSDGIYFDTSKFHRYGQLGGQKLSDKKAGARVVVNQEKRHPSDFAVWKFSRPGEQRQMEWASPWGVGFPGWHLECSAMSMKELGPQFEIHTGGVDHIPVHHENEIAQSETATGKSPFVRYWLHGEFLVLPKRRMGKSEGNMITLQDVTDRGIDPLAFRFLCLQTHYRQKLQFSWAALESAAEGYRNLWQHVADLGPDAKIGCAEYEQRFREAINDDLNAPQALAVLHELLKSDYPGHAKRQSVKIMDQVFGLRLDEAQPEKIAVPEVVHKLLAQREQARQAKDFARADSLRQAIAKHGFTVDDTPLGPRLRKA